MRKKQAIYNLAKRYQPREKAKKYGLSALNNHELLALVIGSGRKNCNVLELAKKVEKTLNKQTQDNKKLSQIFGIGEVLATKILASLELGYRFYHQDPQQIDHPSKIFALAAEFAKKKQEHCLAFYLNGRQELLSKRIITIGSLNFNFIEPRDIFEPAFLLGASSFILAHNHPSNNPEPSTEDLLMTKKIAELAELMGVKLLDHLIICQKDYYSIRKKHLELFSA